LHKSEGRTRGAGESQAGISPARSPGGSGQVIIEALDEETQI